jgi:hypothetical protein
MTLATVRCYNCGNLPEVCPEQTPTQVLWQCQCLICGVPGPLATSPEIAALGWNAQELRKICEMGE